MTTTVRPEAVRLLQLDQQIADLVRQRQELARRFAHRTISDYDLAGWREGLPPYTTKALWQEDRVTYESLPCQFCGSRTIRARPFHQVGGLGFVVYLECRRCGFTEEG